MPSVPPKPFDDPRVGSLIADRYRLDSLLGEGGMGRVYAAEHVMMRKRLAVKVLHRELTSVPEVVARFEREAMAAANIEHPNVAAATDFGKLSDGSIFMVMEYVEGRNHRDEVASGPFEPARAGHVTRQIAAALGAAHALSIVHRDLKPENVMLVTRGGDPDFVKVLDFGIARVPIGEGTDGKPITKVGMVFGTPEYMAPEQALGQTVDARADLYALGVICFELLAGLRPFTSGSQTGILGQQLSRGAPTFAERCPGLHVPPSLEQVVLRLLEREASARYQTADEVIAAIDAVLGQLPVDPERLFTRVGGSVPTRLAAPSAPDVEGAAQVWERGPGGTLPFADEGPPRPSGAPGGDTVAGGSPRDFMGSSPFLVERPLAPPPMTSRVALPRPIEEALDSIDRWRGGLPAPLARIPPQVYLAGLGVAAFCVVAFGTMFIASLAVPRRPAATDPSARSSTSIEATTSASDAPTVGPSPKAAPLAPEVLERARQGGLAALQKLVAEHPRAAPALLALAEAELVAGQVPEALTHAQQALAAEPERASEASVVADRVYELAVSSRTEKELKQRAEAALASPEFGALQSPGLRVALALRAARGNCSNTHGLLDEVIAEGDTRAVPYVQAFRPETKGCKKKRGRPPGCDSCMNRDGKFYQAIAAAQSRKVKAVEPPRPGADPGNK